MLIDFLSQLIEMNSYMYDENELHYFLGVT